MNSNDLMDSKYIHSGIKSRAVKVVFHVSQAMIASNPSIKLSSVNIRSTNRVVESDLNFLRFEQNSAIFFFKNCVCTEEGVKKLESFCVTPNICFTAGSFHALATTRSSGGWNNGHAMLRDYSVKFGRKLL